MFTFQGRVLTAVCILQHPQDPNTHRVRADGDADVTEVGEVQVWGVPPRLSLKPLKHPKAL